MTVASELLGAAELISALRPTNRVSPRRAAAALQRFRQLLAVELGQPVRREEPVVQRKAAAFVRWHEPYKSRGLRAVL